MATTPQSTKFLTHAREQFVTERRCKGYTERRIAADMADPKNSHLWGPAGKPISHVAVHKIIKRVDERLLAKIESDVERLKRRQTIVLERNVEDLRDAYEKSTQAIVHKKQKTQNAAAGKGTTYQQNEVGQKTQVGDHGILRELRETLADVRKIWGADAPVKTDATIHGSMAVTGQDLSNLTDDELETLQKLQQKLSAAHTPNATPAPTNGA